MRKENFDEHGGRTRARQIVPGRSWAAWARALGHLLPPLDVADLGCGEGYLTIEASRFAKKVIADRSIRLPCSGARAGAGARAAGVTNIEWKRGELEKLPLKDASVDVALLSQALHHAATRPARSPKPSASSGRAAACCCSSCARHEEQWVRERLGDKWLGFDDDELTALLEDAGLADVKVTVGARRAARSVYRVDCQRREDRPSKFQEDTHDMPDNTHRLRPPPPHAAPRASARQRASSSSTARWGR